VKDLQREKYVKLMSSIEDLEDIIEKNSDNIDAREKLAEIRNELARVCDGCGSFHSKDV
jgi:hypothetical protein